MKIPSRAVFAAAQISAVQGNIEANIAAHMNAMEAAVKEGVEVLVFPELSLTGYELALGGKLQVEISDPIFSPLQAYAAEHNMLTIMGMPIKAVRGNPYIGAVILGGVGPRFYAKKHVHESEAHYFQSGEDYVITQHKGYNVGIAVCADLTHEDHAVDLKKRGADIYACGALVTEAAFIREETMLQGYASDHNMVVIFSNYSGKNGIYPTAGKSSIWAAGGDLVAQACGNNNELIIAQFCNDNWRTKTLPL